MASNNILASLYSTGMTWYCDVDGTSAFAVVRATGLKELPFSIDNPIEHCLVLELFSDYDCEIHYHPSKANVVADALSRKERVKLKRVRAMNMILQSSIKDRILAA
ncbi:hypothetical protein Tco_1508486 [Tanacetum coccineum]